MKGEQREQKGNETGGEVRGREREGGVQEEQKRRGGQGKMREREETGREDGRKRGKERREVLSRREIGVEMRKKRQGRGQGGKRSRE